MKAAFTQIYARNIWGSGSGDGSLPKHTKGYRRFLERFIRDKQIKSVVDYGCGDWQFSRLINWDGVRYLGLDIVDSLIEHNLKTYRKDNITFEVLGGTPAQLPDAELIILKDVLSALVVSINQVVLTENRQVQVCAHHELRQPERANG